MASEVEELKNMILHFRVSELQMLLGFAGRNKSGRKNELQQRALELIRIRSQPVYSKIRELYKSIQQSGALTTGPVSQPAGVAAKDLQSPPALTPNMPQPQSNIQRVHPFSASSDTRHLQPVIHNKQTRNPLYTQPTLYQYAPQQYPAKPQMQSTYPVHPDVRFKRLPFYDVLADLIKPSTLIPTTTQRMQEALYQFHLTPAQATDIASNRDLRLSSKLEYVKQIQLRFCLLETSCEQEDNFPPSIGVKVNNKVCQLPNPIPTNKPGVEPKRPPREVNITHLCKLSPSIPNTISINWGAEYGRGYVMSVTLVHKLNSTELLQRLKQRGIKHSDFTRGLIKEKLSEDADCEIATTSLRVSLMCPLGKMRMTTPCRATTCQHLQCFDASLFLQMNERKPTWNCPVCDKSALYDHLVIDGYFQDVLASVTLPNDTTEIHLHKDGSWSSQLVVKKEAVPMSEMLDESVQIIDDDVVTIVPDEKSNAVSTTTTTTINNNNINVAESSSSTSTVKNSTVVDLTLSDSEDEAPVKRKTPPAKPDSTNNTFNDTTSLSSTASVVQLSITSGSSSVSSSGYRSPSVITLDSPSPPNSPAQRQSSSSSCMQQQQQQQPQPQPPPHSLATSTTMPTAIVRPSCMLNSNIPIQSNQQQQPQSTVSNHLPMVSYADLAMSSYTGHRLPQNYCGSNGNNGPSHLGMYLDPDESNGTSNYYPQF